MRRILVTGVRGVAVILAAIVALAAFPIAWFVGGQLVETVNQSADKTPVPIDAATLGGTGPGALLSATTMPAFSRTSNGRTMESARVVYRSTFEGKPTVVTGSVFTPKGPPPQGGWPVVAFGHGTTGIDKPCALSWSDSLLGQAIWAVGFTAKGYAVAMADFQGLGSDGVHPYLDNDTAGLNVIDSVRALRATFKGVSNRWAAFGGSQGGGAVWAADEQAGTYAPELNLVGALAITPSADVVGLVDKAQAGTLTKDQGPALLLVIESLARLHPELNRDDYRSGAAKEYWNSLSACSGKLVNERLVAIDKLQPDDLAPKTPEAGEKLRELMRRWVLPQRPLTAPLYVAYGGKDTFIDYQWTADALERACRLGGDVVWKFDPQAGHSEADGAVLLTWMEDRFAGKPVGNDCP